MMHRFSLALGSLLLIGTTSFAWIPYVGGSAYSENFNGLSASPGPHPWVNNSTVPGWYAGSSIGVPGVYEADNGSSIFNGLHSYGANLDPDRALGSVSGNDFGAIGVGFITYGVMFRNTSTLWTLTQFSFEFFWEQWRDASEDPQSVAFEYKVDSNPIDVASAGGWLPVGTGLLFNIQDTGVGPIDGNTVRLLVSGSVTIAGGWQPGDYLMLRWYDTNSEGSDHGMAVDDFTFSAVPEPTTFALVGLGMGAAGLVTRRLRRKKAEQAVAA